MKQTKIIILLGLIFGLMSCTQTKYFVKSEQSLSQIDFDRNTLNLIPLTAEDLENSEVLRTTYQLLTSKKRSKLGKYLSTIQSETPDFYLAKTLYHISKTEYQEAVVNLRLVDENYFVLLRELLFIDLNYELAKHHGVKDFSRFLRDYQALVDKHPDNDFLKKIVALRIRYVRYNR